MRVYRLLIEVRPRVWTYVVAAPDAVAAWQAVQQGLPGEEQGLASLEELEATGHRRPLGAVQVLHRWLSGGPPPVEPLAA